MNIIGKLKAVSEVPTPPVGYITIFTDIADNRPKYKDSNDDLFDYTGPQGVAGTIQVGTVTTTASNIPADVDNVGTAENAILNFSIPRGRSITTVVRTAGNGAEGTTDTYTITYDDGTTSTFPVYNGADGRSIVDITRTAGNGAPGTIDTYTITYTKAPLTSTFEVYNGADGNAVAVADENTNLTTNVSRINFTGAGVTASNSGTEVTVNIPQPSSFGIITGNTGSAASDQANDTVAITGVNGISTEATDTPDGLVISPTYGSPVTIGATNADGSANTFARSNHVHAHGDQAGGTLHAAATTSTNGFMSATDKTKLDGVQAGAQVNAVTSVFGRNGAVVAQQSDYDAFFTTPAEAAAAAPVQSVSDGTGISVNQTTGAVVVTNADRGSTAVATHEAAADPHPQYTTTAEAAAAAPVQSVNGQTGNVTIPAATNNNATTRTDPTASASTAITTIASLPIAAGEIVAGSEYEFFASLRVINTTTATNSVVTVSVGATNVLVLTQANGTTAAASPGAPVQIYGRITFYSATQAECIIHLAKSQAVAANAVLNTSAPITVAAESATTIDLKYNTSGTTATFICRQATIQRIK